jgi:hypothetical protein
MNQSGVSVPEPIIVGVAAAVTLIESAAKDLEDFNEENPTAGHLPSWGYPKIPDGLALCLGCWRLITARQLGVDRCRARRRWLVPQ